MPLTAKHRSSLYQSLAPIVGEEGADALLSQHPGSEADSLVTTGHLRAEMAELRVELHQALRRQTIWVVSALFTVLGVVLAVAPFSRA